VHPLFLAALLTLASPATTVGGSDAFEAISLPGGPPVAMDYLAFDPASHRLWVPAGNTGRIFVLETRSRELRKIEGVVTARRDDRLVGASSATVGSGMVYVGDRADSTVCAYDATTLARRGCATLSSPPDGLAYVATTREVWVTSPKDGTIGVLSVEDPGAPRVLRSIELPGVPEGYAVDPGRGVFYTNLEDKDRTLAIDVRTRNVTATWSPGCGEKGPRGLAVDTARQHLFVACTDRLKVLDAKDGAWLSEVASGAGVDNIDFLASRRLVYVASGKDARLTIAAVAEGGSLKVVSTTPTAEGCRTVVADDTGSAYLPDPRGGRILIVRPPAQ
jgi:DNA-binding beta-propeller fold protein YncE